MHLDISEPPRYRPPMHETRPVETRPRSFPWQLPAVALAMLYLVLAALGLRYFFYSKNGHYHGDFGHFYWAAQAMVNHHDLYTSGNHGYIYPPLIAFLFQPLALLSERGADVAWMIANVILNAGSLFIAVYAVMQRLKLPMTRVLFFSISLIAAILSVDKIRSDFALGQTDALMTLSFALILLCYDKNPILPGLAVGFGACIKYLQLIFLPYFFFRRRYAAIVTSFLGIALFSLLPALSTGWNENLHNLHSAYAGMFNMADAKTADRNLTSSAAGINGIEWDRSISLTSDFSRLDDQLNAHKLALLSCFGAFCVAFILLAKLLYKKHNVPLFFRPDHHPANDVMLCAEWATLIILSLILGPQTTSRHMMMLLPVYALAAALLLAPVKGFNKLPLLLATIVVFLSLILPLPPAALDFWRKIAGASWCAALFAIALIKTSLDYADQQSTT